MNRAEQNDRMKVQLGRAAAAYCLTAVLFCTWMGIQTQRQLAVQQAAADTLQQEVNRQKPEADRAKVTYHDLVSQQERDRASYSGPEAIEMSSRVQAAKAESVALGSALDKAIAGQAAAAEQGRLTSLRLVPLIALGILHALALGMLLLSNPRLLRAR